MKFFPVGSWFLVHHHCSPPFPMNRHLATTVSNCSKLLPPFAQFFSILHRWWWVRAIHSIFVGHFVTLWQASSLFFAVLQVFFEDCYVKDNEYATIFAARKPSIVAHEKYATNPRNICHHSQPMSSKHRSRSLLIRKLATHSKNWLPISCYIRSP